VHLRVRAHNPTTGQFVNKECYDFSSKFYLSQADKVGSEVDCRHGHSRQRTSKEQTAAMYTRNIQLYANGRRDQNKVALTFDDGPTPGVTEQVLQILESKGARGTFFVVGKWMDWLPRGPELIKRIRDGGHVIGNHSYLHGRPAWDFEAAEELIRELLGQPSEFVRPPYFAYSTTLARWAGPRKILLADVIGFDWESALTTQDITHNVIKNVTNGSIILLHDGSEVEADRIVRPARMVAALPVIIDVLQERGFELVGVDELVFDEPQQVAW
jgi:peptidoglycan/xylan/chitin deacetylase (PgdA/CDA1 family)